MDNCIDYIELISAYADNELSEFDMQRVESHLRICANCSSILKAYRGISFAIDESSVPAPEALSCGVMEKIKSENVARGSAEMKKFKLVNRILTRYLPAVACLVFLLLTVPRLFGFGGSKNSFDTASAPRESSIPTMAASAPQSSAAASGGGSVSSSANESGVTSSPGSNASMPEAAAAAPEALQESSRTDSYNGIYDADSADSGVYEEPAGMAPAPSAPMDMVEEEADLNRDDESDVYPDDVYAVITITGELPALLEKFEPVSVEDSGELYYEISRSDAKTLISEISGRDGVVISITNDSGKFAQVYYNPNSK